MPYDAYMDGFEHACRNAGRDPELVKKAWIFSAPLGAMGTPTSLVEAPYYAAHAVTGPSEKEPTGRLKSLGLAGLSGLFGLMGLGFMGMGGRDLGRKLMVMAARSRGRPLVNAIKGTAHEMDVPAYSRFAKAWEQADIPFTNIPMGTVGKHMGYAAGGIAHPFNKLEDLITKGMEKAMGPQVAESLGSRLNTLGGRVMDNPAIRFANSPWMFPPMIAGGVMLQPDLPVSEQVKQYEDRYGRRIR